MQKKDSKTFIIPTVIYIILLLSMVSIWIYLRTGSKTSISNPINDSLEDEITDLNWYDAYGNPVQDLSDLYLLNENGEVSCLLPADLPEGNALCFRAKHTIFSVYLEDELIYAQELPESSLYTNSNGATWNTVPLLKEYAGCKLTIKYELCYDESGCGFDRMCICSEKNFILDVLRSKIPALSLSFTYLILGVVLVIADLIISKKMELSHSLFYLGFIAISVAAYCMVETQVFQIFISDQKIMHLLSIFSMIAVPIPVLMYAETLFDFKWKYTSSVLSGVSLLVFIVTTVMNAVGIMDYHESMKAIHIMLIVAFAMMIYAIIRYLYLVHKKNTVFDQYILFMIAGLVLIILCGIADVIRFYTVKTLDPALFTRVGFLGTIICFGIASSRKIIDVFKLNTRLEVVTKLAYEDGLTGLYNRTSYGERMSEYEENETRFGIVMMDVNNLKKVNDNLGHDDGDKMLVEVAGMIKKSFDKPGMDCFRIGGDEFVVLVCTPDIEKDCDDCKATLEALYNEYNSDGTHKFEIVIAKGYSIYEPEGELTLKKTVKQADEIMYKNKQELKGNAS
jgi:diguanylate cyclase (GGDEF)-like protein